MYPFIRIIFTFFATVVLRFGRTAEDASAGFVERVGDTLETDISVRIFKVCYRKSTVCVLTAIKASA